MGYRRNIIMRQLLLRMFMIKVALVVYALRRNHIAVVLDVVRWETGDSGKTNNSIGPHAVTQAGSSGYQYDPNGNMTNRTGYAITYDYDNRAVSLAGGGGTVQSVYDYTGQRVEKTTLADTTVYIGKLYECTNGNCTRYIFAGSTRIASEGPSGEYFYQGDHLGSSSVVTDQNGYKMQEIHYYPFGQVLSNNGSIDVKYKYTGQPESTIKTQASPARGTF